MVSEQNNYFLVSFNIFINTMNNLIKTKLLLHVSLRNLEARLIRVFIVIKVCCEHLKKSMEQFILTFFLKTFSSYRNLPLAIAISCSLVTVVYVLTNVAFYSTLSPAEVLGSAAVAVSFADRLFGSFSWIIPVFVALSTFGAVNGILLTSSRLFYAGACHGQMPTILTMIQQQRMTPAPAVLAMVRFFKGFYLFKSFPTCCFRMVKR